MIRLLLILFLFPLFGNAQLQYPPMDQRWGVSLSHAFLVTPIVHLTVQPGVEYRINKRLYLLTEFAYAQPHRNKDSSAFNRKYFRIRSELRYMLPHGSKRFHEYLAFQFSYAARSFYHSGDGYYYETKKASDAKINFTSAIIKSPIWAASGEYVFDFYPFKLFYAEPYAGFGIRNINTHYSNVKNPQPAIPISNLRYHEGHGFDPIPLSAEHFNTSIYRFHLSAGIRLLYRFH